MSGVEIAGLEMLRDVEVGISVQVGSARLPLAAILGITEGSVVSLECAADAPARLLVNGVIVASG